MDADKTLRQADFSLETDFKERLWQRLMEVMPWLMILWRRWRRQGQVLHRRQRSLTKWNELPQRVQI